MIIHVKNVTKRYGDKTVVDNISFSVDRGGIFGFLGKNGAGKSTTINMMTGICHPTAGEIILLGQRNIGHPDLSRRLGVLPDSSNYYTDLTARQHMLYFASLKEVNPSSENEVLQLLSWVGLSRDEDKKVGSFSLGMKKKLGIAQALIGDPDLLFLDEPTSTLDPESAIIIRELIAFLASQGKTIFMTSHNLEEVEKICDRVAIMERGRITKIGTLDGLRKDLQSNVKVIIRSRQHVRESTKYLMSIRSLGIEIEQTERGFLLWLGSEELIPEVVARAVDQDIRVYGVEVEQLSLEDIFLDRISAQA